VRMDPRGPAGLIQALSRLANAMYVDDLCADAAEERGEKWGVWSGIDRSIIR
jgi:hypothetical protein